jgi:ferritin
MKVSVIFLFAAVAPSIVAALQSPYLTQLGGQQRAIAITPTTPTTAETYTASGAYATQATAFAAAVTTPLASQQELIRLWSDQVSVELAASQLYLSASIWCRGRDLDGMAGWMLEESGEEREHGLAILEMAMKKNFPVQLNELSKPRSEWSSVVQVWEDILHAEKSNTHNLLKLAAVADQCGDYACKAFLGPFHMEQLDAEDKVGGLLNKVRQGLVMEVDHQLAMEDDEH